MAKTFEFTAKQVLEMAILNAVNDFKKSLPEGFVLDKIKIKIFEEKYQDIVVDNSIKLKIITTIN